MHRKLIRPYSYPDLHVEPFPVEVVDDLHPEQVCTGRAAPAGLQRWICHDFRENEDVGGWGRKVRRPMARAVARGGRWRGVGHWRPPTVKTKAVDKRGQPGDTVVGNTVMGRQGRGPRATHVGRNTTRSLFNHEEKLVNLTSRLRRPHNFKRSGPRSSHFSHHIPQELEVNSDVMIS